MSRFLAALFLCLSFASPAQAQALDCANATGLTQRVCEAPELIPLEEERRQLLGELQFVDPAHSAIQGESAWLASQEACADDACLTAAYVEHNRTLREALDGVQAPPDSELLPAPELQTAPTIESSAASNGASPSLDSAPAVQPEEYLFAIAVIAVTFLIALWLVSAAARARRR